MFEEELIDSESDDSDFVPESSVEENEKVMEKPQKKEESLDLTKYDSLWKLMNQDNISISDTSSTTKNQKISNDNPKDLEISFDKEKYQKFKKIASSNTNWWEQKSTVDEEAIENLKNFVKNKKPITEEKESQVTIVEEKVLYAGETIVKKSEVDRNSRKAKAFVNKKQHNSKLDNLIYKYSKKKTMSTIEKSNLDWEKDKAVNNDATELEEHTRSKDAFLSKTKFLNRSRKRTGDFVRDAKKTRRFV